MGVSTNIYTVFGLKIEWNEDFSEAYEEVYEKCDLSIIFDGMCGEYIVFGDSIFDSGDFRYGMEGGDSCTQASLDDLLALETAYKAEFLRWFPSFAHLMDDKFKIITFTHFH